MCKLILELIVVTATLQADDNQNDNEDRDRGETDQDEYGETHCLGRLRDRDRWLGVVSR